MKKKYILMILILSVGILVSGCNNMNDDYKIDVKYAKTFFDKSEYARAYSLIKDYSPKITDKKFFNKVKVLGEPSIYYDRCSGYIETSIINESHIKDFADTLITGIIACIENEEEASKLGLSSELKEIKDKFLKEVDENFELNEEDVKEIAKLSSKEKEDKLEELVTIGVSNKRVEIDLKNEEETKQLKERQKQREKDEEKEKEKAIQAQKMMNPFKFEDVELIIDGNYVYCKGYIKNVSDIPHSYVRIKVVYYDKDNNILDTDWTYAVSSEGIYPEERKSFEIMTRYTEGIEQGSWSILDYQ